MRYCVKAMLLTLGMALISNICDAGVLLDSVTRSRAIRNWNDTSFSIVTGDDSPLSDAVACALNDSGSYGGPAREAVLALSYEVSYETPSGDASRKIYYSMLVADFLYGTTAWNDSLEAAIDYPAGEILFSVAMDLSSDSDIMSMLGSEPLRWAAAAALYGTMHAESIRKDTYTEFARRCLEMNITHGIDQYGGWKPGSPGDAAMASEYMFIIAKAMKNSGIRDYFGESGLHKFLTFGARILPPQQSPMVHYNYMTYAEGATPPAHDYSVYYVLAAADVSQHSSTTAEQLMWYWQQCGRTADPLVLAFADTTLPLYPPPEGTRIAGSGITVMRHNQDSVEESVVYTGFGPPDGYDDLDGHHADSGDFSFIWQGIPLTMHNGWTDIPGADGVYNKMPWRHNLVLRPGVGNTPVISERPTASSLPDSIRITGDFYPDGIAKFITTPEVDYVSGEVRLPDFASPGDRHYRHVLYIKPDALLVHDQYEGAQPAEWNLWMPFDTVVSDGSTLHIAAGGDVNLDVIFPGSSNLDFTDESAPESITWDWPLIMRTGVGSGTVTLSFADILTGTQPDPTVPATLLSGILTANGSFQGRAALIGGNDRTKALLNRLGISFDVMNAGDIREARFSDYRAIMVCGHLTAVIRSELQSHREKFRQYTFDGGHLALIGLAPARTHDVFVQGDGFVEDTLELSGCPMNMMQGENVPDKLFVPAPHADWGTELTPDRLKACFLGDGMDAQADTLLQKVTVAPTFPSAWSDRWKVLLSIRRTIPVKASNIEALGEPSRIRVKQAGPHGTTALLLARQTGSSYRFDVTRTEEGFIELSETNGTWRIYTGGTDWTDAPLVMQRTTSRGVENVLAVDCTFCSVGTESFRSTTPFTINYNPLTGAGTLWSSKRTTIATSRVEFKIHAGSIRFNDLYSDVWTSRINYLTTVRAVDDYDAPVAGARVFVNGMLSGETNADGTLPVRWIDKQPEIVINYRGRDIPLTGVPDMMDVLVTR